MHNAKFLKAFLQATTMIAPWEYDKPPYGRDELDDFAWRSRHVWWRPQTVEGLDPAMFRRLDEAARAELAASRQRFLESLGPAATGSERERVLLARDALLEIYQRVGPLLTSNEVIRAARLLNGVIHEKRYQDWFVGFTMEFGNDWDGTPSIDVVLIVDDFRVDDPTFFKHFPKVADWIREDLREEAGVDRHMHLTARTVGEQAGRLNRGAA